MCEIYAVNTVLVGYLDATFLFIPLCIGIRSSLVCSLESNEKCKKKWQLGFGSINLKLPWF